MRIYAGQRIDAEALSIRCEFRAAEPPFDRQAEIVWPDDGGNMGVRFVKAPRKHQKAQPQWLGNNF